MALGVQTQEQLVEDGQFATGGNQVFQRRFVNVAGFRALEQKGVQTTFAQLHNQIRQAFGGARRFAVVVRRRLGQDGNVFQ
jgi:hypothetical protein